MIFLLTLFGISAFLLIYPFVIYPLVLRLLPAADPPRPAGPPPPD